MTQHRLGQYRRAAVLGGGVMGSQLAAHLTGAGFLVDLFDLPGKSADGLKWASARKPPAFFVPSDAERVVARSLETDLERLTQADWIIEAVVEDLAVKRDLLARVEAHRRPGALTTTNTSGISVRAMSQGRSDEFRRHFLGAHFFNPPRYMHLLEVVPTPDADPDLVETAVRLGEERLGKGVVRCQDTPLFVANRIGIFVRMCTIWEMVRCGLSIEAVDAICGPLLGRPRTAVFRLGDLVGLDTTANVARYLHEAAPDDERRDLFQMPPFIQELLRRGALGDKSGGGYYRKEKTGGKSTAMALDWKTMEYRPRESFSTPSIDAALQLSDPADRIRSILAADDDVSRFVWKALSQSFLYAARRLGEITSFPADVDRALRWGFNWELGLFEIWDAIGLKESVARMEKEGLEIPAVVRRLLADGRRSFYEPQADPPTCIDFATHSPRPILDAGKSLDLDLIKRRGPRLLGNDDASLFDLGDGVLGVEFHSKMNTLGPGVVGMLEAAMDRIDGRYVAAVVGNPMAANFSAGANLRRLLDLAKRGEWRTIDRRLQTACVRLGCSGLPVVAAPHGLALGGGAEILLRVPYVQASAETSMGLVETRVGLIPGAGGSTEMLARTLSAVPADADPFPALKRLFDLITRSTVSTSARDAMRLGYLRPTDGVSMNRRFQLAEAKAAALRLAEQGAPLPSVDRKILALGRDALAKLRLQLHLAREAGEISPYDVVVGEALAKILCGGDLAAPRPAPEQYFLDLERESFLSLLGDERTQARIESLLETGQPVRN